MSCTATDIKQGDASGTGAPELLRDLQFVGIGWGLGGDFVACSPHFPHICGDFVDIYSHFVNDSSMYYLSPQNIKIYSISQVWIKC